MEQFRILRTRSGRTRRSGLEQGIAGWPLRLRPAERVDLPHCQRQRDADDREQPGLAPQSQAQTGGASATLCGIGGSVVRKACLLSIYELARRDDRVVFIGSDITKQNLEKFSAEYPDRFFMEGIYEAHIIGMAAGLALNGKIPYINTIATFLTRRCYEQILVDLGLHNLPVRLLGSGGGTVYAPLGPTHLANEDIAILRAIPNMTIVAPCDADEMGRLMPQTLNWNGPVYVRMAKGGDRIVSSDKHRFEIGKAIPVREGGEVLFVST